MVFLYYEDTYILLQDLGIFHYWSELHGSSLTIENF